MNSNSDDIIWGPISSLLSSNFSFYVIKEIVGNAGLSSLKLSHLVQRQGSRSSSKGQLITGIDAILRDMNHDDKQRFFMITTEEILRRNPELQEPLRDYLNRLGWTIHEGSVIPIELLDTAELPELPEEAHSDLVNAATRLRDGNLSGAISSACGAVDSITTKIYNEKVCQDPGKASFQEKVNNSLRACGVFTTLERDLAAIEWADDDIKRFNENLKGSLNQAAYIMQTLRSKMGDVHGTRPVLKPLVFDSLKWAALIIRLLKCE